MNTYDFDKTIFYPDSSCTFYLYCLRKFPGAVLPTAPRSLLKAADYGRRKLPAKQLKEQLFSFLPGIGDIDAVVARFWEENKWRIAPWYLAQRKEDDIIISASPEFLLEPICRELGVRLIGTRMDKYSGRIEGENCHDREKVRRFRETFPGAHTENFYSDSLTDQPMAELADRAFLVDKNKLSPWPFESRRQDR